MNKWYYYLHTNGELIGKPPIVVESDPQYFDSPFVKETWTIDTEDRATLYVLLLEALALNANLPRVIELAQKWSVTYDDTLKMLQRVKPTQHMKDGMDKFIEGVLGMNPEDFWKKLVDRP